MSNNQKLKLERDYHPQEHKYMKILRDNSDKNLHEVLKTTECSSEKLRKI